MHSEPGRRNPRNVLALTSIVVALIAGAGEFPGRAFAADCNANGRDDALDLRPVLFAAESFEHYAVGLTPRSVVASDLDGDGDLDLATANRHSNSISVLLGSARGRFSPGPILPVTNPAWLVAGDFTGDRRPDFVTFSSLSSSGVVLEAPPEGFGAQGPEPREVHFDLGSAGFDSAAAGDLDADGELDLVVASRFRGLVHVLFGGADGFSAPVPLRLPEDRYPRQIELAASGRGAPLDIIVAADDALLSEQVSDRFVVLLRYAGDRRYERGTDVSIDGRPAGIVARDLDGDGAADLAWYESQFRPDEFRIGLRLSNGETRTSTVELDSDASIEFMGSVDVDGDGAIDLYVATTDERILTLLGDGSGGFEWTPSSTLGGIGTVARHAVAADLDGDGRPELATAGYRSDDTNNRVSIIEFVAAPASVDRNLDGVPDECAFDCDQNGVNDRLDPDCNDNGIPDACDLVQQMPTFVFRQELVTNSPVGEFLAADFDEDGKMDVVAGRSVLHGGGNGGFGAELLDNPGVFRATADFDGDGHMDISSFRRIGEFVVLFGDGRGGFDEEPVPIPSPSMRAAPVPIDFNGDGLFDLAYAPRTAFGVDAEIVPILQASPRRFEVGPTHRLRGTFEVHQLLAADLTGNGWSDLLLAGRDSSGGTIHALLRSDDPRDGDDLSGWSSEPIGVPLDPELQVRAVDIDLDDDIDIVVRSTRQSGLDDGVHVLWGTGAGRFVPGPVYLRGLEVSSFDVGEVDGDSFPDLVATVEDPGPEVWFLLHPGDRTRSSPHIVGKQPPARVSVVHLADWNDDGLDDALFWTERSSRLHSYLNRPGLEHPDCDADGVLDSCAIVMGVAKDCDGNGIPDACKTPEPQTCDNRLFAYRIEGPDELQASEPDAVARAEFRVDIEPLGEMRNHDRGASSWSIGIAAENCSIVAATVQGTMAAHETDDPPGLRVVGFESTQLASDGDVQGAVSAVLLSAIRLVELPTDRASTVLRLEVEASHPGDPPVHSASLYIRDGLRGSSTTAVANLVTVEGASRAVRFDVHPIRVLSSSSRFRRGDANDDGRVDISDSIFVLSHLFLGGDTPPCRDAADADDNGALELTDGVFINTFLFLGGNARPAPGVAECAEDPTEDGLGCARVDACE